MNASLSPSASLLLGTLALFASTPAQADELGNHTATTRLEMPDTGGAPQGELAFSGDVLADLLVSSDCVVATAEPFRDLAQTKQGRVHFGKLDLSTNTTTWTGQIDIPAEDAAPFSKFGTCVRFLHYDALADAARMAVSAMMTAQGTAKVYIYDVTPSTGQTILSQILIAPDIQGDNHFGRRMECSDAGQELCIGAFSKTLSTGFQFGDCYTFSLDSNGQYQSVGNLGSVSNTHGAGVGFALGVSDDGGYCVAGAPGDQLGNHSAPAGGIYLYRINENGVELVFSHCPPDMPPNGQFGFRVSEPIVEEQADGDVITIHTTAPLANRADRLRIFVPKDTPQNAFLLSGDKLGNHTKTTNLNYAHTTQCVGTSEGSILTLVSSPGDGMQEAGVLSFHFDDAGTPQDGVAVERVVPLLTCEGQNFGANEIRFVNEERVLLFNPVPNTNEGHVALLDLTGGGVVEDVLEGCVDSDPEAPRFRFNVEEGTPTKINGQVLAQPNNTAFLTVAAPSPPMPLPGSSCGLANSMLIGGLTPVVTDVLGEGDINVNLSQPAPLDVEVQVFTVKLQDGVIVINTSNSASLKPNQ